MEKRNLLLVTAALAILLIGGLGLYAAQGGSVDCEKKYNQTLEGDISPDEIPDSCRPLPEDVERKILAKALAGQG